MRTVSSSPPKRIYDTTLRDEQAKRTRERVLDGFIETMKKGLADLSVPAVARAARVSVPTVYRHFPTKKALYEAAGMHLARRIGLMTTRAATSPEELAEWVRQTFAGLDAMDPEMTAAMTGVLAGHVRRRAMIPRRLEMFDAALAPALDILPPAEREHMRRVAIVLTSSAALRTFQSYLGVSAAEAAETVVWTLGALVRAARAEKGDGAWKRRRKK